MDYPTDSMLLVYHGKLPSLNEVINQNRANKFAGAQIKSQLTQELAWTFKPQCEPITDPCCVLITFYEPNKRRDIDNIQSSTKFILDALVMAGILVNDTQRYVTDVSHKIATGPPLIVVQLFPNCRITRNIEPIN